MQKLYVNRTADVRYEPVQSYVMDTNTPQNIDDIEGSGTPDDPWQLTTPPGRSGFDAYRDPDADPAALVVQVGRTQLRYHLRCIEDLHAMLTEHGDWMPLGNADEGKEAKEGTVEA